MADMCRSKNTPPKLIQILNIYSQFSKVIEILNKCEIENNIEILNKCEIENNIEILNKCEIGNNQRMQCYS